MESQDANEKEEGATNHAHNLSLAVARFANAVQEYCQQQPGKVRRYPFAASKPEREAVRRLIAEGRSNRDWKAAIDVDVLEKRHTHWIRVEMPSSAEFVARFTCPNPPGPGFQGDFEDLEIREFQT